MDGNIRLTVVALLPEGVKEESVQDYVAPVINGEDPTVISTVYRTAALESQVQRFYVKISKLVNKSEIEQGWHLRVTERFSDAGCADVAWRISKVDPGDVGSENTTASFPLELFQNSLENDDENVVLPGIPLEPFGSDAFWEWFVIDAK